MSPGLRDRAGWVKGPCHVQEVRDMKVKWPTKIKSKRLQVRVQAGITTLPGCSGDVAFSVHLTPLQPPAVKAEEDRAFATHLRHIHFFLCEPPRASPHADSARCGASRSFCRVRSCGTEMSRAVASCNSKISTRFPLFHVGRPVQRQLSSASDPQQR